MTFRTRSPQPISIKQGKRNYLHNPAARWYFSRIGQAPAAPARLNISIETTLDFSHEAGPPAHRPFMFLAHRAGCESLTAISSHVNLGLFLVT
jgi:hypothetical protein